MDGKTVLVLAAAAGVGIALASGGAIAADKIAAALPVGRPGYYGGHWGTRRPPGLPESARTVGQSGDAKQAVASAVQSLGFDSTYGSWAWQHCRHESSGTIALPANNFNALPEAQRNGARLVTAWGAYQFNRDAMRQLLHPISWLPPKYKRAALTSAQFAADSMPWDCDAWIEILGPVNLYGTIYAAARERGFSEQAALTMLWLYHAGPQMALCAWNAGEGSMQAEVARQFTRPFDFDRTKTQGAGHFAVGVGLARTAIEAA